jgi:hypothetical protein
MEAPHMPLPPSPTDADMRKIRKAKVPLQNPPKAKVPLRKTPIKLKAYTKKHDKKEGSGMGFFTLQERAKHPGKTG